MVNEVTVLAQICCLFQEAVIFEDELLGCLLQLRFHAHGLFQALACEVISLVGQVRQASCAFCAEDLG